MRDAGGMMEKLTSILVLIDPSDRSHRVMAKAGQNWRQIAEGTDLLVPGR